MSSFHDFAMVPASGGRVQLMDATGSKQELPVAAAIQFVFQDLSRRLVIDDAGELPRTLLPAGGSPAGESSLQAIISLAHEGRLVCLSTLRQVIADAACPRLQLPTVGSQTAVVASIPAVLNLLKQASIEAGVPEEVRRAHGPLGLASSTRAALACGIVSMSSLPIEGEALQEVVAACRHIADHEFASVIVHPEAPPMFKGGKEPTPDRRGFFEMHETQVHKWLQGQLDCMVNRFGLPVDMAMFQDLAQRKYLRQWPRWILGTAPLLAMSALQDAQALASELERAGEKKSASPRYSNTPVIGTRNPDLGAYRRFRRNDRLLPLFVPPAGAKWLRLSLPDLPLVALAAVLRHGYTASRLHDEICTGASPGERCRQILLGAEISCDTRSATAIAVLISTGLSPKAITVQANRVFEVTLNATQVEKATAALEATWPELRQHLAHRSLGQLAAALGMPSEELDRLVGHPCPGSNSIAFFHRFVGSELSTAYVPGLDEQHARDQLRRRRFANEFSMPEPTKLTKAGFEFRETLAEQVVSPTGRVRGQLPWIQARACFQSLAEEAVLAAVFDLILAGHRIAAFTPEEILVELPAKGRPAMESELQSRTRESVVAVLGLPATIEAEPVPRW